MPVSKTGYGGSIPSTPAGKNWSEGEKRERGRENGSFPVAEILKPLGFKAQPVRASSEISLHSCRKKLEWKQLYYQLKV